MNGLRPAPQTDGPGTRRRRLLQVALAVGAGLAAARSDAQFGGGMRPGGMAGRPMGGDGPPGGRPGDRRESAALLEVTLHELQEDLRLRPEQEPMFETYARQIRALTVDASRERRSFAATQGLSLLQRIERNVDAMRNRLAALEEIADAAKVLASTFSPEQQVSADPRLANLMLLPLSAQSPGGPPIADRPEGPRALR